MEVLCVILCLLYFSSNLRNKSLSQLTPLSPFQAKSTMVSNVQFQQVFVCNFVYFTFKNSYFTFSVYLGLSFRH